ncbi:MAG: FTR1 family protein, partial [Anaerolineae bacterium]|nr:FTR1 family protein [Anaerolineae bacterium]
STARLNLRLFFNVTGLLLLVFSAGLLAHGIHEFQEAGVLIVIQEHLWDTNAIIDETSTLGTLLQTLVGYNANPSLLEVIGYWLYWGLVLFGMRWLVDRRVARKVAVIQTA